MFHIGVLSAFFADSDFMTLLQSSREGGDALGQPLRMTPPNGHFIAAVVATVGRTLLPAPRDQQTARHPPEKSDNLAKGFGHCFPEHHPSLKPCHLLDQRDW